MIIGSAWLKEKDGKKYYSCIIEIPFLGKINFAMFKVDEEKRTKENSPNMSIVWSAPKEQKSGGSASQTDEKNPFSDDDIPF